MAQYDVAASVEPPRELSPSTGDRNLHTNAPNGTLVPALSQSNDSFLSLAQLRARLKLMLDVWNPLAVRIVM